MEKKFLGIVLKCIDYKERDKLVSIFSVVDGLILGKLKGVKGAGAKLKMLSSPFCFAEFMGIEKGGKLTITGGDIIDSFFDITNDIESFYVGCCVLDYIYSYLKSDESDEVLKQNFSNLVSTLKSLCYIDYVPKKVVLIKYFLNVLKLSGYALDFCACSNCKKVINEKNNESAFIDFFDGSVKCERCTGIKNIEVFSDVMVALKQIENMHEFKVEENVKSCKDCGDGKLNNFNNLNNQLLNDVLRFLGNYIFLQMNYKIKIEELLKM